MLCIITGGGGFIGRHLSQELLNAGYRVRVLDRLDPQVHGDAAPPEEAEGSRVELVRADVRDRAALRRALEGADLVVHLAAQVGVGQSMYEIDEYVGTNDHGTAVLLQALIEQPVRRIVVASSMSVYGEGRYRDGAGHPVAARRRRPADLSAGRWDAVTDDGRAVVPVPTDEEKAPDLASTRIDLWKPKLLELLGRAGCVSIEAGLESLTVEGRESLAKRCRLDTPELAELLIDARRHVPFVQANLIGTVEDSPELVAHWRDHLVAHGVWANDPVPLYPYPSSPSYRAMWGMPDEYAWERAHDHYLAQFHRFSDLQDSRPLPLDRLEAACCAS